MIHEARCNGMSTRGLEILRALFEKHRKVFRIKLGPDPPANVKPLNITPIAGVKPHRSPQRRYAPAQLVFITNTINEQEKVGAVYKNPNSKWASPALVVPKPGSDSLRFTVDPRGPNSKTVRIQSAMPHLDSLFQDCEGSSCFTNLDFCHLLLAGRTGKGFTGNDVHSNSLWSVSSHTSPSKRHRLRKSLPSGHA